MLYNAELSEYIDLDDILNSAADFESARYSDVEYAKMNRGRNSNPNRIVPIGDLTHIMLTHINGVAHYSITVVDEMAKLAKIDVDLVDLHVSPELGQALAVHRNTEIMDATHFEMEYDYVDVTSQISVKYLLYKVQ